jgi:hypothetical protein
VLFLYLSTEIAVTVKLRVKSTVILRLSCKLKQWEDVSSRENDYDCAENAFICRYVGALTDYRTRE